MRTLLNKLREFKGANVILFVVFATTIYLQCCFFHENLKLPENSLLTLHMKILKASIAITIASLIFFFKHKSWIIYVSAFINMWGISNIMYQRANGILVDAYSVTMIGNMDGFWSSVPFYMSSNDFIILYTTLIVIIAYILFKNKEKRISDGIIGIVLAICIHIWGYEVKVRSNVLFKPFLETKYYNPFSLEKIHFACWDLYDKAHYTRETSIVHHFIYQTHYFVRNILFRNTYKLSEDDANTMNKYVDIKSKSSNITPNSPLYILIIESFETWALNPNTMPNLYNFIQKENILFAPKVITQTRGGTSADGQMIINTGLLPTKEGAVCFRYPDNTFPAISKLYNRTFNVIPGGLSVWNQTHMNTAYGINKAYSGSFDDKSLIELFIEKFKNSDYGMLLTMSTHSPFEAFYHLSNLTLPANMPEYMSRYLKSFNYTDACLQPLLSMIETDEQLKNATIVITGDHTIFNSDRRNEFTTYSKENNENYNTEDGYTPLIIYSPNIEKPIIINDLAYQMDIFPTILDVIGCKDYYWKGFGISLFEEGYSRKISPEEALDLSDKLHQANYFEDLE